MARYTGPKTKISRIFGEPILGNGKWLNKNSNPPGQHGAQRKRKSLGEYALQLREKQKAKYTYGVLEKQFRKTFEEAARRKGVTGENLIKLLEARLDNTIYRMGIAPSRPAARQELQLLDRSKERILSSAGLTGMKLNCKAHLLLILKEKAYLRILRSS